MKIIWLWLILIVGVLLVSSISILSKNQPLLEKGFGEIRTFVYGGGEPKPILSTSGISINPYNTIYTGNYKVIRRDGNESLFDVSFNKTPVKVIIPINKTHNSSYIREDTMICLKAGWDEKQVIIYNPDDKKIVEKNYTYSVPSSLSFYKEERLTKQSNLIKTKDSVSATTPLNPNKFCYQANPEQDFYLKFGENTVIVIQVAEVTSDSLLNNVTAEGGNFTHISIDDDSDVYLKFDGNSDTVDLGDIDIAEGLSTFSVSIWARLERSWFGSNTERVIRQHNVFEITWGNNEAISFIVFNESGTAKTANANIDLTDNDWHHYVGNYNGTGLELYIDSVLQTDANSRPAHGGLTNSQVENIYIGSSGGVATLWNGSIDEVRIYANTSLSQANVTEIYNSGRKANSSLPSENLTGWWKFDEGVGVSAGDSSGGNDGTLVGDTSWSTWGLGDNLVLYMPFDGDRVNTKLTTHYDFTKNNNDGTGVNDALVNGTDCNNGFGNCLQLDAQNDYIDTNADLLNTTFPHTLSAWVKPSENGSAYIITGSINAHDSRLGFDSVSNLIYRTNSDSTNPSVKITTEQGWTHVAVTFNGSMVRLFINGSFIGGEVKTASDTNENFRISSGGTEFSGLMDEVMIFNTSLTDTQVLAIYENQSARFNETGTQKVRAVKITDGSTWDNAGNNSINLSIGFQANLNSELSARIGQINLSVNNSGLVLYMPFEWGSAVDISGEENDGTITNAIFNETGGLNDTGGFEFDGTGDYIRTSSDVDAITINNDYTISIWANIPDYGDSVDGFLISHIKSSSDRMILIVYGGLTTDKFTFGHWNGSNWNAYEVDPSISDTWQHIVAVRYANMTASIYVNGVDVGSAGGATTSPADSGVDYLSIGTNLAGNDDYFNGTMDEFMIFNRSLSPAEILTLYNNQSGKKNIAYYTDYQNITGNPTNFTINPEADFVFPDFKFYAGNSTNPFYTPILNGSIILETWNFSVITADVSAPTFSNQEANETPAIGEDLRMNITITDDNADSYKFFWNNTGSFVNDSSASYTSGIPVSTTKTGLDGNRTCWGYWANDTGGFTSTSSITCFTATTDSCSCPSSGNFEIINGDICTLSTICDIGSNKFRVLDGAMLIQANGFLRAGGCHVTDGERLFVDDSGGLYCEG